MVSFYGLIQRNMVYVVAKFLSVTYLQIRAAAPLKQSHSLNTSRALITESENDAEIPSL